MPPRKFYKRKYNKRRNYRKPSATKRMMGHITTGLKYGKALAAQVKFMASMINCEKKFVDIAGLTLQPTVATQTATLLNGLAEGDDSFNRDGRSILMSDLHIRWTAKINSSATNTLLKYVIVCDKKPDITASCTYSQVYGAVTPIAMIDKLNEGDRFVILKQGLVKLNAGNGLAANGDLYLSLKGIHAKFDGTDATSASLEKNAIYLLTTSDEATNAPTMLARVRFSYYDN